MGARILIIEDNAANLALMVYLLRAFGHTTLAAEEGETGLRVATRDLPDLILCDVQMPKLNGYELARRAKDTPALRRIPIVAVTAFAMVEDRERALAAGFDGYLSKPIEPETFVQQVEVFLEPALRSVPANGRSLTIESPHRSGMRGPTILVIDDLQAHLDFASSLLEPLGYTVITVLDAQQALHLARQALPDLVISDVCMPAGGGYYLIEQFKRDPRLKSIPFMFVTSTMATEHQRQKGLALGAARFLFRPIEPEQLLANVEMCLRRDDAR
ncbi:MAG: response regulator [Burkholderiales bacterium]